MGLNWEEGLKGGAQGLALMQRSSQQKTDILYKQISERNMMRFRREESAADRDFKEEQNSLNRESQDKQREATNALTKSNQDATAAYRKTSGEQGAARLTETSRHNRETEKTQASSEVRRRQDSIIKAGEKEIEALGLIPKDEDVAAINKKVARKVSRAELDNKGALAFDSAYKTLGDTEYTMDFALRYGRLTPEERKDVDDAAKGYIKGGMSKGAALGKAIGAGGVDLSEPAPAQPDAAVAPETGADAEFVAKPELPVGNVSGSGGSGSISVSVEPVVSPEDKAKLEGMFNPKKASSYGGSVSQAVSKKQALKQAEDVLNKIQSAVEMKEIVATLNLPQEQKDVLIKKWYEDTKTENSEFIQSEDKAAQARDKVAALREYNTRS